MGENYRRGRMTETRAAQLRNNLYAWVRELPPELRLFRPGKAGVGRYHFASRQMHIIFFTIVTVLSRKSRSTAGVSAGSVLAASFTAAIFEEFLIRDEIRFLGPAIFKFFLLTAGITLIPSCRVPELREDSVRDLQTIRKALQQFSQRYPSALATIHTLSTMEQSQVNTATSSLDGHLSVEPEIKSLFTEFGPGLCRQWRLVENLANVSQQTRQLQDPSLPSSMPMLSQNQDEVVPNVDQTDINDGFDATGFNGPWPLEWTELDDPMAWVMDDSAFD